MTDNALGQDLTGRLAVVTGGAQGIGRSIVEALAEAGARLVIADLNPETGERTAAEVGAEFVRIDVTSSTSVSQVVADLVGAQSSIDIWVNNAGIDRNAAGEEMSDEDWSAVMAVNLDGTFYCCREVGGHMLERGRGFIVNIASMSGVVSNHPQPQVAYNASQADVIMVTNSLAGEWASRGVRINSVSPGYTPTAILDQVIEQQPEWTETWFRETPMGRAARPTRLLRSCVFSPPTPPVS
jgi:NAD(P)-dependent dehydrogenase (short-subunit alcohol dehydrogenase family)